MKYSEITPSLCVYRVSADGQKGILSERIRSSIFPVPTKVTEFRIGSPYRATHGIARQTVGSLLNVAYAYDG